MFINLFEYLNQFSSKIMFNVQSGIFLELVNL
jgi:hypothetical protein